MLFKSLKLPSTFYSLGYDVYINTSNIHEVWFPST